MGAEGEWTTDGLTVVVTREPASSGSLTFVLVHGIGVSSRYFERLSPELAKVGTVYLVDLPGYGASPKAGRDVSITDHATALAGFLRQAGVINPVLVGHSMGCQVVSMAVARDPGLADHLVLMAPTMPPRERSLLVGAARLLVDGVRNPLRADRVIIGDYLFRCGMPYFFAQTRHLFRDHIEDRFDEIKAKTLVIAGDHDLVVPIKWSRQVTHGIADARLEVVRGPHVMMYRDPARIAELLAAHGSS